jgi:hypothetical protein
LAHLLVLVGQLSIRTLRVIFPLQIELHYNPLTLIIDKPL